MSPRRNLRAHVVPGKGVLGIDVCGLGVTCVLRARTSYGNHNVEYGCASVSEEELKKEHANKRSWTDYFKWMIP